MPTFAAQGLLTRGWGIGVDEPNASRVRVLEAAAVAAMGAAGRASICVAEWASVTKCRMRFGGIHRWPPAASMRARCGWKRRMIHPPIASSHSWSGCAPQSGHCIFNAAMPQAGQSPWLPVDVGVI
ncbi:hypothetical protein [Mycolicibacterium obuense]|uniref:hypothetical protein n=1 Tax=Mycolicibacterium obuense TaxID=1807 RepID=UPI00103DD37B|nr:hypothetical protein [Mycolicibacterium obuense]